MKDFAAIDFETANNKRSYVCSVGIVIVRNREIIDSSSRSQTIITNGAVRYMGCVVTIRTLPLFSLKCGNR